MDEITLINFFEGTTSEAETRQVLAWLDESEANMQHYQSICRLYEALLWFGEEKTKAKRIALSKPLFWKKIGIEVLKVAAIVALTFFTTQSILNTSTSEAPSLMQTVHAPYAQHAQVVLADGSKVWLNAGSSLQFPSQFDKNMRQVRLKGEGFFEVKANPEKPFIVATDRYSIRATGTAFNVCAYDDAKQFETALLSGTVYIRNREANNKHIKLSPKQKIILDKGQLVRTPIQNFDYFDWREGILCFDETLKDVFKKLEIHFDVQIEITKNANIPIADYCVGKFRTRDGLEHILRVLRLSHRFRYKMNHEENKVTIY